MTKRGSMVVASFVVTIAIVVYLSRTLPTRRDSLSQYSPVVPPESSKLATSAPLPTNISVGTESVRSAWNTELAGFEIRLKAVQVPEERLRLIEDLLNRWPASDWAEAAVWARGVA